jgi:hypothetical protein
MKAKSIKFSRLDHTEYDARHRLVKVRNNKRKACGGPSTEHVSESVGSPDCHPTVSIDSIDTDIFYDNDDSNNRQVERTTFQQSDGVAHLSVVSTGCFHPGSTLNHVRQYFVYVSKKLRIASGSLLRQYASTATNKSGSARETRPVNSNRRIEAFYERRSVLSRVRHVINERHRQIKQQGSIGFRPYNKLCNDADLQIFDAISESDDTWDDL